MFSDCSNLYNARRLFSVDSNATLDEIQSKYKSFALKYHPDKYSEAIGKELATQAFQTISTAYDLLKDFYTLNKTVCCQQTTDNEEFSCCQSNESDTKEVNQSRKRPRTHSYSSTEEVYQLTKWYIKDWHVKFLVPHFIKITPPALREHKSKILISNLQEDYLSISIPILDADFLCKIQIILKDTISVDSLSNDNNKMSFKIPKEKIDLVRDVVKCIFEAYKFPPKLKNFICVLCNSKDLFNLGIF